MAGSMVFDAFGEQSNYHFVRSAKLHLPGPFLNLSRSERQHQSITTTSLKSSGYMLGSRSLLPRPVSSHIVLGQRNTNWMYRL